VSLATGSEGYTAKRVLAITGVRYQTLNLWAKTGLISPSITDATGTGTERVYNFRDLVALKVAVALRDGGVSTKSLARVIRFLREHTEYENPLSEARLVVTGGDVLLVRSNEELISTLTKPGQSYLAFVVDLPKAVDDVSKAGRTASAA
jgi:DNA-binding transcriptional MerR regulator